ncbi:MAG: rhomboid family intramembrane serine protease [Parachlamydiaceae bacterium]
MRLVYSAKDVAKGHKLSAFLSGRGIENKFDVSVDSDWGNHTYSDTLGTIWVYDEDKYEEAISWINEFDKNSEDPQFAKGAVKSVLRPQVLDVGVGEKVGKFSAEGHAKSGFSVTAFKSESLRRITIGFFVLCCLIFAIGELTEPSYTTLPTGLPRTPLASPPINKQLYYDYPHAFELLDKLVRLYGIESLQAPKELPSEGGYIFSEFKKTPYWEGGYDIVVEKLQGKEISYPLPTMFEKIRDGEVWRLFTPCLLHNDILHLVFNMIWLIVLGRQMEQRLSARKYLLILLFIGVVSNTCQYLVTGSAFLGFSGILCGMLTFIWMRQKVAPWEGYPLERSTFFFMMYFILTMLLIQCVSFYMEIEHNISISPGIANTAHFSGAIVGALLGCLPFFSWKTSQILKGK